MAPTPDKSCNRDPRSLHEHSVATQLSLFDRGPGFKEPTTSKEAARAMAQRAPILRQRAIDALLKHGPMTSDEVAGVLGESVLAIRPRCSELLAAGLIAATGLRRRNGSGMSAHVWRAT